MTPHRILALLTLALVVTATPLAAPEAPRWRAS